MSATNESRSNDPGYPPWPIMSLLHLMVSLRLIWSASLTKTYLVIKPHILFSQHNYWFTFTILDSDLCNQWMRVGTNIPILTICVKYIPLLCRIWPGFIQKSSLFHQQGLGMIQTHVTNSQFFLQISMSP